MDENENERQFRVIDQMLSMHATLRDKFKKRSLFLNIFLLSISVFLCALVFADKSVFFRLGLSADNVNILLGLSSVICFFLSLIEYRVNWQGQSALHADAVKKLANLKSEYYDSYNKYKGNNDVENRMLSEKYKNIMGLIIEIPETSFATLKAKHLKKILLSKKISRCPTAPVALLKIQLIVEGILCSLKNKSIKNPKDK